MQHFWAAARRWARKKAPDGVVEALLVVAWSVILAWVILFLSVGLWA